MSSPVKPKVFALAGNPNCGKSTIFNALTGLRQKVANFPGVTVERKEGRFFGHHGETFRLIDLPGAYSLNAQSPDEEIMRDVLLGRREDTPRPDVVVCVLDASNAERHFYLATQILELGLPAIIVLNMTDIAESRGIEFDPQKLSDLLGVPVVAMQASSRKGLDKLRIALSRSDLAASHHNVPLPDELETVLQGGEDKVFNRAALYEPESAHHASKEDWEDKLIASRYGAIREICEGTSCQVDPNRPNRTEQIDRIALHPVGGPAIAFSILAGVFFLIFSVATIPMDLIDGLFGWLSGLVEGVMPEGDLRSLITDGIIAGIGGVLIFLPQILILFFFIGLMESTGYLSRLAFMLDRAMSAVGLSGKSFVPLLSSYACAVPGVMGARTVDNPKDRLITILVAPLTSCSARLPVYAILLFVFIPAAVGNPMKMVPWLLGLYLLGTLGVIVFAWIFNRFLKGGEKSSNIMELPTYKRPSLKELGIYLWQRAKIFIKRAGTIILGLSILLWAAQTYPKLEGADGAAQQEQSFAGKIGHFIEPVIEPLGYDWKIGVGLVASFAAREVFVSAMAVTYSVESEDDDETSRQLLGKFREAKRPDGTKVFTPLTCLSLLVFYVFAMQCLSTVAVVRRETNSWRWPLFQIGYMTAAAYLGALIVFQGGKLMGFS
ncbi:MAG: ferrous iron transport protein B [Verrucomicrobiales bacterium]